MLNLRIRAAIRNSVVMAAKASETGKDRKTPCTSHSRGMVYSSGTR